MNTVNEISDELNSPESRLNELSKAMPYDVPSDFFQDFEKDLLGTIKESDTPSWSKEMPFTVPQGYFEGLTDNVVASATLKENKGKTKPLVRSFPGIIKWAAAAVLVIGIGFGALNTYLNNPKPANPDILLGSVSSNEIHDYLQHTYRLDVDRIVSNTDINKIKLDNSDIIEYLNETGWD